MHLSRRFDPNILLLLLLCVFAVAPLTAPGFFMNAHDATIGTYFLWQFDAGIKDGTWWPVWGADMVYGYGYPLFLVIAPLPYYLAEGFLLLGMGIVEAIKAVYALAFLFSGLSMYLFARSKLGREGGLVAAVAYVYIPYHLVDIYVRADLAEFAALAFFPAILWAVNGLCGADMPVCLQDGEPVGQHFPVCPPQPQARRPAPPAFYLACTALLYGGLILTHLTMAVIFTPVVIAYVLWVAVFQRQASGDEGQSPVSNLPSAICHLPSPIVALSLGLMLAAAFIIPILTELRYVKSADLAGGYFSYSKHFVYFFQFFSPFWGFGYAGEGPVDQMPYQLGVVPVVLAILSLGIVASRKSARPGLPNPGPDVACAEPPDLTIRREQVLATTVFFQLLTVLMILLMLGISLPLWDLFKPIVSFIQFPWRLLVITALSLAFLSGVVVVGRKEIAPLLIVLLILGSYAYTAPQYTDAQVSLKNMVEFQVRTHEMLGDTVWVKERPQTSPLVPQYLAEQPLIKAVALAEGATATTVRVGGASVEARVQSAGGTGVILYTRYFPGWRGYVDGQEVALSPGGDQGLITLDVPAGEHAVQIRYQDTMGRTAGKLVSVASLLAILGLLAWARWPIKGQDARSVQVNEE